MKNTLKNKDISQTPFRRDVLKIFNSHKNAIPLSVIEQELSSYNRVTLYRTIKSFIEKNIIHEIVISGEESKYALSKENKDTPYQQHIHFKCRSCNILFCSELDKAITISLEKHKIERLDIQAFGICNKCNIS
ncbi:MAG: transcriptional repressor [Flavobacteriaceae bacterium]|nr:transcriptional repressor [Flavobacteriaceae bacterium]